MKKLLLLMFVSSVFAGVASAAAVWNPAANAIFPPDVGYWNDAANWTGGIGVPTFVRYGDPLNPASETGKAVFNVPDAAECVVNDANGVEPGIQPTLVWSIVQGDGGPGGVLRVPADTVLITADGRWSEIGYNNTAHMIVERGGEVSFGGHLWMGHDGTGLLDINGGTVTVNEQIGIGTNFEAGPIGSAVINVNAGLLRLDHWQDVPEAGRTEDWSIQDGSYIDIGFGQVEIFNDGDQVDEALAFAAAGKIKGFGVDGNVQAVHEGTVTTITANDPMDRYPTMEQVIKSGPLTLTWTNMDPNYPATQVWVDVYYGSDPNNPHQWNIVNAGTADETSADAGSATEGTRYWQINSYLHGDPCTTVYDNNDLNPLSFPVVEGAQIMFYVSDDMPPSVVMDCNNMLTWAGEPVTLKALITDDGVSALNIVWTSPNEPNIIFTNPTWNPGTGVATVTVTGDSHQAYSDITITVGDQKWPDADSSIAVVDVARDACHAAGGGWPHLWDVYTADIDESCIVNLADFAVVVQQWLDAYALTVPLEIP